MLTMKQVQSAMNAMMEKAMQTPNPESTEGHRWTA